MAKGTTILLFILSVTAFLLLGVNLGKKIGKSDVSNQRSVISPPAGESVINTPTYLPTETQMTTDNIPASPSASNLQPFDSAQGKPTTYNLRLSTYTDKKCGFSFSYPGSYLKQKTVNEQSVILTDPADPNQATATTCAASIPRPPLTADKIESIILDGTAATLYHDQNAQDGSPRDEVIVKNPNNNLEIIIAGYGNSFKEALRSFKFLR